MSRIFQIGDFVRPKIDIARNYPYFIGEIVKICSEWKWYTVRIPENIYWREDTLRFGWKGPDGYWGFADYEIELVIDPEKIKFEKETNTNSFIL